MYIFCPVALSSGHVTCLATKMWAEDWLVDTHVGDLIARSWFTVSFSLCQETCTVPFGSGPLAWVSQGGCSESELQPTYTRHAV